MLGYNEGFDKGLPLVELFGPLSRDWHQRRFWTSFWFAFLVSPFWSPFSRWHQRRLWTSFWFAFWSPFWSLSRDGIKGAFGPPFGLLFGPPFGLFLAIDVNGSPIVWSPFGPLSHDCVRVKPCKQQAVVSPKSENTLLFHRHHNTKQRPGCNLTATSTAMCNWHSSINQGQGRSLALERR